MTESSEPRPDPQALHGLAASRVRDDRHSAEFLWENMTLCAGESTARLIITDFNGPEQSGPFLHIASEKLTYNLNDCDLYVGYNIDG